MVEFNLSWEIVGVIGAAFFALLIGTFWFGTYYLDMKSKNPELHAFNTARQKPFPPIVALCDLSGRLFFFNAEKDKPQDVKLKKDDFGLLIDSRIAAKMPKSRMEDGTTLLMYGINFHFPLDPNGARGIIQLIRKIRAEYPDLNFIRDDIVLMELLTKTGEDLAHDVGIVLKMYPQETQTAQDDQRKTRPFLKIWNKQGKQKPKPQLVISQDNIVAIIEDIKGQLKEWRVESGFFTMKDALDLLPIGTTSQDMKKVEIITKTNDLNEMGQKLEWWKELMPAAFYAAAIMVGIYIIVINVAPKG